jgi:hypothetical protein
VSLQPISEQSETIDVYAELKQEWIAKLKELQQVQSIIHEIDNRFNSFGLTTREAVGLALDDVKHEEELFILDHNQLSKNDLAYKKELLYSKKQQLSAELKGLRAVVRQLEMSSRAEKAAKQAQVLHHYQETIIAEYNKNPQQFVAELLEEFQAIALKNPEEVYVKADKLIALSSCFTAETPKQVLWAAWKFVAKARDVANAKLISKYNAEARKFFVHLIHLLPAGMQGLIILYDAKDYDRSDYYLNEIYTSPVTSDPKEYLHLLQDLADELEIASRTIVRNLLAANTEFNKLSKKHKTWLIEQQAYMYRLRYDLSFAKTKNPIAELGNLLGNADLLDKILHESMQNPRKFAEYEERFELIKKAQVFKTQNAATSCKIGLGSGLGCGWLLGKPSMSPEDYRFIRSEDTYWDLNFGFKFSLPAENIKPSVLSRIIQVVRKLIKPIKPTLYQTNALLSLDRLSPGFGAQLATYFQHRANEIKHAIEHAIAINNREAADLIQKDLSKLEQDWHDFLDVADKPEVFCALVDQYLDSRYKTEREQYLATTQTIKNCFFELSKSSGNIRLDSVDDIPEQRSIQQLHALKSTLRSIRVNV